MTNIQDIARVKGSTHTLPDIMALPGDDCNILIVSSRTLSLIQDFGNKDVAFLGRYASLVLQGNRYVIADVPIDLDEINGLVNAYRLECVDMSCDFVAALEEIAANVLASAQAGCGSCGSEVDPVSEDTPPVGPGEPWADLDEYDVYKCKAANWMLDGLTDFFQKMLVYDVDFWTTTTVAVGTGLISSILLTTIFGGWVLLVAGAVIGLITKLIVGTLIDLTDIKNVLVSDRLDLICALYTGSDADSSRTSFLAVLTTAGLNAAETGLIEILMVNSLVNQMYSFNQEIEDYTATTSCATCGPEPCPFDVVFGTGTPTYDQQEFVITAVVEAGNFEVNLQSPATNGSCSAANWCVEYTATDIVNPEGTFQRRLWCWDTSTTFKTSGFTGAFPALDTPYTVASMQFISNTPFTVTMKINGKLGFCSVGPSEGCA